MDVLVGPRVQLICSAPEGPEIALPAARLICLMLLAIRAMLGMNGVLKIVLPTSETFPVAVLVEGEKAGAGADQHCGLAGGAENPQRGFYHGHKTRREAVPQIFSNPSQYCCWRLL